MVECNLAKVEVAGSNPVSRSSFLKQGIRRGRCATSKEHEIASGARCEHPDRRTQ